MSARVVLVCLVVLSTAGLVIGTTIERNAGEPAQHSESAGEPAHNEGEEPAHNEGEVTEPNANAEEWRPLGIDIEAAPFVALAAITAVGLAAVVLLRPRSTAALVLLAGAMVVFAFFDVREISHQSSEGRTGLAVLAAVLAAMHLAAAVLAVVITRPVRGTPHS